MAPMQKSARLWVSIISALLLCCLPLSAVAANACVDNPHKNLGAPNASALTPNTAAPNISAKNGGITGTGMLAQEGGITGTGMIAQEGGITGTGITGTGIFGIITGFGSICVNQLQIHFDDLAPVYVDGVRAASSALAIGQVVRITAGAAIADELTAQRITVVDAVSGPVQKINLSSGQIEILGQRVRVSPQTRLAMSVDIFNQLQLGQMLRVSGLRHSSGEIIASRIALADQQSATSVVGQVSQLDERGFMLHGLRVNRNNIPYPAALSVGQEMMVAGRWDGQQLHAQQIEVSTLQPQDLQHMVVQGFIHPQDSNAQQIRVSGTLITLASNTHFTGGTQTDLLPNQSVQISARIERQGTAVRVIAERVDLFRDASGLPQMNRPLLPIHRWSDRQAIGMNDSATQWVRYGMTFADLYKNYTSAGNAMGDLPRDVMQQRPEWTKDFEQWTGSFERVMPSDMAGRINMIGRPDLAGRPGMISRPDIPMRPDMFIIPRF